MIVLEDLPDELLLCIFDYVDTDQLFNAFWGLNERLNRLFQSCQIRSLNYNEETDLSSVLIYSEYVNRMIIDTSKQINLNQFPNVHMLVLANKYRTHFDMIDSNHFSRLTHLTLLLGANFTLPIRLLNEIFSNKFPSLIYADLGKINYHEDNLFIDCPSLKHLAIRINQIEILTSILNICPNLNHLQLHILNIKVCKSDSSQLKHSLHRLTLWTEKISLDCESIQSILCYAIKVQHLYLQTECEISLIDLCKCVVHQLPYLYRFRGHIKYLNKDQQNRIRDVSLLHEIHPCFDRMKSIEDKEDFCIFATD